MTRRGALSVVAAAFALRFALAFLLPPAFDEAYYWRLSRHLAWGYLDHPPAFAWTILAGTVPFGNGLVAVRLGAILCGALATLATWRAGAALAGDEARGAAAGAALNLMPAAIGLTAAATIDAPLIGASALFLWAAIVAARQGGAAWLAVGAAAGLALLSKYSALFEGLGLALWLVATPAGRRHLATPWPWLGLGVAIAVFAPNLAWNAGHGWATFAKQFGRVGQGGFAPLHLVDYPLGQVALMTPPILWLAVVGARAAWRGGADDPRRLVAFVAAPLPLYMAVHALHQRVEANWLAAIYPAVAVLAAEALAGAGDLSRATRRWAKAAAPVGLGASALALAAAAGAFGGLAPVCAKIGG
ncbi:MAG: glycosyltransferase family 39 protein, partial [Hyphomicrobiales bacterium]|nr:glycosyltransferase family 39 protein [Hyphomicrobiales bacterium]